MKFLIDECLSPNLADIALDRGFPHSAHVNGIQLGSRPDSVLVRHAIDADYVLVTNNSADFTELMRHEPHHPGLICIDVVPGLMNLSMQERLFELVLAKVTGQDLRGKIVEIRHTASGKDRFSIYPPPAA
ncbi:MAG: DUF5615 family PIN-like protein [Alphaproteobacteria bacterium]|nr:DUF5615 family PIN-like protein [Alphaproteobacteria bacterium]